MTQIEKPAPEKKASAPAKPRKPERELTSGEAVEAIAVFDPWMRCAQVSMIGLFVIALLWCGYVAQPVIVPVMLGWAIATCIALWRGPSVAPTTNEQRART